MPESLPVNVKTTNVLDCEPVRQLLRYKLYSNSGMFVLIGNGMLVPCLGQWVFKVCAPILNHNDPSSLPPHHPVHHVGNDSHHQQLPRNHLEYHSNTPATPASGILKQPSNDLATIIDILTTA